MAILRRLAEPHDNVLATRAEPAVMRAVAASGLPHRLHADARIVVVQAGGAPDGIGLVVVMSAGTADLPVAEEAAVTAEAMGNRVERIYDCGVAGLHRLVPHLDRLDEANAIVVVAGMEGALPSVVGGPGGPAGDRGADQRGLRRLVRRDRRAAGHAELLRARHLRRQHRQRLRRRRQASQINHLAAKLRYPPCGSPTSTARAAPRET